MAKMLSIKEAAKLAQKNEKTIRRWLRKIVDDKEHPDRDKILPSYEDARELKLNNGRLIWSIEEKLIRRAFLNSKTTSDPKTEKESGVDESEVDFLRRQIESMQGQLDEERQHNRKMQVENNDRQKEMNILMRDMQLRLEAEDKQPDSTNSEKAPITVTSPPSSPTDQVADPTDLIPITPSKKPSWLSRWTKYGPAIRFDRKLNALRFYIARGH